MLANEYLVIGPIAMEAKKHDKFWTREQDNGE
jgi:hypothetical protein